MPLMKAAYRRGLVEQETIARPRPGRALPIPDHVPTPKPIRDASDELKKAVERFAELERAVEEAALAVDAAEGHDANAAADALEAGKSAPKATAPIALARAKDAATLAEAGREAAIRAQDRLLSVARENRGEWLADLDDAHRACEERLRELSEEVTVTLLARENLHNDRAQVAALPEGNGSSNRHCRLNCGRITRLPSGWTRALALLIETPRSGHASW